MAENTKIEWAHHTFNPWRGCTKVSRECDHCYAETMSGRNPDVLGVWGKYGTRVIASDSMWRQPLSNGIRKRGNWGERHRVFCASLADVFEGPESMPEDTHYPVYEARIRLAHLIYDTPNLDWMLLTKRPENIGIIAAQLYPATSIDLLSLSNVWLGCVPSAIKKRLTRGGKRFDCRSEGLNSCPTKPAIGPVDWRGWEYVNLIISGGESGSNARPSHPDWHRNTRDFCNANKIAYHFKQWGEWRHSKDDLKQFEQYVQLGSEDMIFWPDGTIGSGNMTDNGGLGHKLFKIGKKAAGRILDGRTWDEYPQILQAGK